MNGIKSVVLVALLGISRVQTQEPTTGTGYTVKVEFESEQVRVMRVRYGPHATSPMHTHTGRAVVAITASHLRVTTSDGNMREAERHPGEIYWGDSVVHSAENLSDAPLETVEIEVKSANKPAFTRTMVVANDKRTKLREPVPVEEEPHHHVVLQNQYVRVLDVLFPPGDPSLFHTHSNDNVSVALSGDFTKSQPMGGQWSEPVQVIPGAVAFHKAYGQPYTHRVGSAGQKPFHVIDVEIFPEAGK